MRARHLVGWTAVLAAAALPALPAPSSASPVSFAELPAECTPRVIDATCTFVDPGPHVLDLPAGVTEVAVRAIGGDGEHVDVSCPTGAAARAACLAAKARWQGSDVAGFARVPDGAVLALFVGGDGTGREGGAGGGGDGGIGQGAFGGGGGGGASRVSVQGSSAFLVAAGGVGQGGDREVGPPSDQDGKAATTTAPGGDGGIYAEPSGDDGNGPVGGDGGNGFPDPNGGGAAGGGGGSGGLFGGGGGGGGYCELDTGACAPAGDGGTGSDLVPPDGSATRGAPNDTPQVTLSFALPPVPTAGPPQPPGPTVASVPDTTATTVRATTSTRGDRSTTTRDGDRDEDGTELAASERRDGDGGSAAGSLAIGSGVALLLTGVVVALAKRRRPDDGDVEV